MDKCSVGVPRVVVAGPCGHGKSLLVQKIAAEENLDSEACTSVTAFSTPYLSACGRLEIIDTPGQDADADTVDDRIQISMQLAAAISSGSVSLILFVVRAETRIPCVVAKVQDFLNQFIDFEANLAICMTHMDKVDWSERDGLRMIKSTCCIDMVMCTQLDTAGLQAHCLASCSRSKRPQAMSQNRGLTIVFVAVLQRKKDNSCTFQGRGSANMSLVQLVLGLVSRKADKT